MHDNLVRVFHPLYKPPALLFSFPADDGPNHDKAPYSLVYEAAYALANNTDGILSLSESKDDPPGILDEPQWLETGDYFYHLPTFTTHRDPWPVVANFRSWVFNVHQLLAAHWPAAIPEDDSLDADGTARSAIKTCQLTGNELAVKCTHIIPETDWSWFDEPKNLFTSAPLKHPAGHIHLTCDAREIWESSQFVIVPTMTTLEGAQEISGWRAYRLNDNAEIKSQWHNKRLLFNANASSSYFYVRFIRDIFSLLRGFLEGDEPRRLIFYDHDERRRIIKMFTRAERMQTEDRFLPSKKRKRNSTQPGTNVTADVPVTTEEEEEEADTDDQSVIRHERPSRSPDYMPALKWPIEKQERDRSRNRRS